MINSEHFLFCPDFNITIMLYPVSDNILSHSPRIQSKCPSFIIMNSYDQPCSTICLNLVAVWSNQILNVLPCQTAIILKAPSISVVHFMFYTKRRGKSVSHCNISILIMVYCVCILGLQLPFLTPISNKWILKRKINIITHHWVLYSAFKSHHHINNVSS